MKWSDLTLKERKQIYDAVRAENPNASYFDIKSQFDLIPEYEDGGKKIMPPKELGLTPGTPEYYKRQQQISGKAELVQPEAYITPAGYIKDAITTAEELEKGNYGNAAVSTLMNVIPWGVGKGLRKIKSRVSNILNTPIEIHSSMVDDYVITIDPLQYLPGTANHELGHLADQLASDANNRYLTYLLDEGNIMGPGELRSKGINIGSDMQSYLLDPSESKSHMLHLKRALVNEGKIHDWSSKVNQNTIEDFLFDPRNTGVVNNANKLQYNMYRNKSRFVDRINNLTPMEFITPLLLPVAGYETNKE